MSAALLRRWTSTARNEVSVVEISRAPVSGAEVPQVLREVASQLGGCSMVILAVDSARPVDLSTASEMAKALEIGAHVCLAIDSASLAHFQHSDARWSDQVGLLLDHVDANTPLSHVMQQGVEAIRFDHAFARQAMAHLPSGCILEAILGLARSAGLCTLGPDVGLSCDDDGAVAFDYVPDQGCESATRALNAAGSGADRASR
jgi:hypothetical protein